MKPKILGTGLSGMIGSRIVELLGGKYDFEDLSLETGIDITNREIVLERIRQFNGEIVLHLAAKADVDACEEDKKLGKDGGAWKVNALGTKNLVDGCLENGKKIIYISTDFVFDGENPPVDGYSEQDSPNPINWYAQTKYEGEKIVKKNGDDRLICRLAFPYRTEFVPKKDFARAILSRLENGEKVKAVGDQIVTPTFIDDVACALDKLIDSFAFGIYHIVGSQFLSPYKAALLIARTFNKDERLIEEVKAEDYFAGRARRPFKLALKNDKITKLGIKMLDFEEGLREVKRQIENSKF